MAEISLSISDLFEQQFGYKSAAFNFPSLQPPNKVANLGTDLTDNDAFGREFFMPVWIGESNKPLVELSYPIVRVESKKTIIDTPLTERKGTVKELIALENYKFTIRGVIVSPDGQWPEKQIDDLNRLYQVEDALVIKSAITDLFLITPERGGHDKVVIQSLKFLEGKGAINVKGYEIELVSNEEFNLNEIN